jgi:Xaa-Pro dipeptidase
VVIYMNTHGGEFDAVYRGYPTKDEVFAFYSENEPANFQQATINGPWMTARAFRDLVDTIKAEEIVLIVESCHSAASYEDFEDEMDAFGLQFGHGVGVGLHERPIISRLNSLDDPVEIQEGMLFALETYAPAADGRSAARIEEEVVVTADGAKVITLFPCEELMVANAY